MACETELSAVITAKENLETARDAMAIQATTTASAKSTFQAALSAAADAADSFFAEHDNLITLVEDVDSKAQTLAAAVEAYKDCVDNQ